MARKRLGEILIEEGLIDDHDLTEALKYKEKSGYRLGTALVALRIIAEWQLTEALGKALDLPVVDLSSRRPTKEALKRIPARLAERFDLIPVKMEGKGHNRELLVAMSDPINRSVIKRMQDVAGCPVRPALAGLTSIQRAIHTHYHGAKAGETIRKANRYRTAETTPEVKPHGMPRFHPDPASTISRLVDEAKALGRKQPQAPPPPSASELGQLLLGLEYKLRAMLHLLLKKQIITEREYVECLRHFLDAAGGGSGGGS